MFTKWWTANLQQPKRSLFKPVTAVILCLSLFAASGCSLLPKEAEEEILPPINPPKLSKKPEYTVKTETLETKVRGVGRLWATKEEALFFTSDENNRIKDTYVQVGEPVEQGQVIADLDVSDLESQLRQRRLQARSDELEMIRMLREADTMSAEELEKAKIDFELKKEELIKLEESVAKAKLVAPFSGTLVALYVKKGDEITAYDTVAIVADLNELTVAADVNESDLDKIAVGMEAIVDINSAGQHKGKVKQLPNPEAQENNDDFGGGQRPADSLDTKVIIELDEFPEGLNRGTPLSISIITQRKENAVVIPVAALRSHAGRNYVQVVEADGSKREVDVEIGQQTSTVVEIVQGLQPGQKVVGR